jgi:hypothetical protein
MMLFSSQVANIKVVQEKQIEPYHGQCTLDSLENRVVFQGRSYVDIGKDGISLHRIAASPVHGNLGTDSAGRRTIYGPRVKGLREDIYPWDGHLYKTVDDQMYYFLIVAHYQTEGEGTLRKRIYEKIYLRSYKLTGEGWMPVNELDISDCLTSRKDILRMAMRLVDNVIVACVNESCVVVDATDPGELKRIDTKLDALKYAGSLDRQKEFAIPLVPVEGIGTEERIRLSIDLNYESLYSRIDIHESSTVDVHEGKIAFFWASDKDVARFDVVRWDQEKVYCRFSTARPFTILEGLTGTPYLRDRLFVKGGKLYFYGKDTLLVFDIRANRGIRKVGHFVRMDYHIEDIAVLDDGNILLCIEWERNFSRSDPAKPRKTYLCLLENPA